MLFNSLDFAVFLPLVFILYWFVLNKNLRLQNLLLWGASFIFYGWWDWRFLLLISLSALVDFGVGIQLDREKSLNWRKIWVGLSLTVNLGLLGFFKYYHFFLENLVNAFTVFGIPLKSNSLQIILPVGISFYTFQTLSYTLDVYKGKIKATRDLVAFMAFISFFPQLVAGPIERASHLLPQFFRKRNFNYAQATDGLRQILWGLVKKIVIADNCAEFANQIFNNSDSYPGSVLFLGAIFFAFQIYGDFSGYSDIAIGTSRLFGIGLMKNFAFPYFSRDIAEFWRRWHISLTTWFRDYVYIPLGGSKCGKWHQIRNIFIIFLLSGFWHGANWTFLFWGALNALYFIPLLLLGKNRRHLDVIAKGENWPNLRVVGAMSLTFLLTVFAWIFFRAENLRHAFGIIAEVFSESLFQFPNFTEFPGSVTLLVLIMGFLWLEWKGREQEFAIAGWKGVPKKWHRWSYYTALILLLDIFGNTSEEIEFIYFQF